MLKYIIAFIVLNGMFISAQQKKIPIFAFHGVPAGNYSNLEQFKKMKDAGIDICYTLYSNNNEVLKALDAAQSVGAQLVIKVPTLFSDTENTVKLFRNHPALYGYCIADEPSPNQFNELYDIIEKIKKYDSNHIFYINLFPNYVSNEGLNGYTYKNYLMSFLKKMPVDFLSFDHYPINNNQVRGDWYSNLEDVRDISKKNNIRFWAFACSTIHHNYLAPTFAGLKLQQFGNLLYGAQGLQYFTYWTNTFEYIWIKDKYGYAIVDDKGIPTPTYSIVKNVNQQIQRLAWVFLGAKSDAVFHTGNEIPQGTSKLMSLPKGFKHLSTNGKNALVSLMSKGKNKFIIFQNKSLLENLSLDYQLTQKMKVVDNSSGKTKIISAQKKYKYVISPGDVLIFMYDI